MTLRGGCLCGAVRYEARTEPVAVRACWCRVCQYFAGGNASVNLVFRREDFTLSGQITDFASTADSGNHMHRGFCPHCGCQITSAAEERPQMVVVRAGTLDDAGRHAPQMLIWTRSAPPWAWLDPALPHHPGQPPPPVLTP